MGLPNTLPLDLGMEADTPVGAGTLPARPVCDYVPPATGPDCRWPPVWRLYFADAPTGRDSLYACERHIHLILPRQGSPTVVVLA